MLSLARSNCDNGAKFRTKVKQDGDAGFREKKLVLKVAARRICGAVK